MSANCKLCLSKPPIDNSHVQAKFLYKRFLTNEEDGGSSIKLQTLKKDSKQVTRAWFCKDCEKLFGESYAARFFDRIIDDPTDSQYTEELLRFFVSCSYRTCLSNYEQEFDFALRRLTVPACKAWRSYLLGESEDIGPFTQHAFVIQEETAWEERMGMLVCYQHDLVFTQLGPVLCFGLLGSYDSSERWELNQSLVRAGGGKLLNLIPHAHNATLTRAMREILDYGDAFCNMRVREFSKRNNSEPLDWSEYAKTRKKRSSK